jgi:hypothetical protein
MKDFTKHFLIILFTILSAVGFVYVIIPYVSSIDLAKEELKYECEIYANSSHVNIEAVSEKVTVLYKNKSFILTNNYSTLKRECFN